jgi:hypothetical protein
MGQAGKSLTDYLGSSSFKDLYGALTKPSVNYNLDKGATFGATPQSDPKMF